MSDPLSVGVSIVTIIQLTTKLALKAKSLVDISECIQQVVTETESFRLVIIALKQLLIQINHNSNSPDCPAVDAQALIYVNDLVLLVNESVKILERLDKILDGIIMRNAAAEGIGAGESENRDLGERVNVTKRGMGKWIWKEDDIRIHLRSLESQKGNLNIIIGILNCHEITQIRRTQAQQLHLQMRAMQGPAAGTRPPWEQLLEDGATMDPESSGSVDHLDLAVNSTQQISSALVSTARRQGWGVSSTTSNARNPLSEVAKKLILNAGFTSVEDGNFLTALFASRVYGRVFRRSTSSGDDMTISDYNLSGRSLFSYRLEQRRASLPLAALVSSPSAAFNPTKQVEIFHKYIERSSIDITKALLEYGVDIQAKNSNGQTPLYVAITSKRGKPAVQNVDVIQLLLEYGADVNAPNSNGERALHSALAIAATAGSDTGTADAVNVAMDIVKLLLAHGADINTADRSDWLPLHRAVDKGHMEVVKLLLEWGAQTEISTGSGRWPSDREESGSHPEAAKLLLEQGAQIEESVIRNWRALHIAANGGHPKIVKLLLERGAQIEASVIGDWRPLHIAANGGHPEVVKLLLERGAQIEASDSDDQRPLYIAAAKGHTEVVKVLLERGAQIEASVIGHWRALHIAANGGHPEVVKLLLEWGAQIEASVKDGKRALHLTAEQYFISSYWLPYKLVLEILLKHGADTEAEDVKGKKPRDYARTNEFRAMLGGV